jgi:hypothetical protein
MAALDYYKKIGETTGKWISEEADSVYRIEGIDGLLWWRVKDSTWDNKQSKAKYYALLGEDKKALEMLESAISERNIGAFQTISLEFKNLRSHPRFIAIREKMGLSPL